MNVPYRSGRDAEQAESVRGLMESDTGWCRVLKNDPSTPTTSLWQNPAIVWQGSAIVWQEFATSPKGRNHTMNRTETNWERLSSALAEDRLAHAYIIQGNAKREGRRFVQRLCAALFPNAVARVEAGSHPDILSVEPQSKSRTILVKQIEAVVGRVQQKSFEGGWKVAVIYDADRMAAAGANKLLKTLEEPPGKTLLLLVTEQPKALLATILSRCQQLALDPESEEDEPWRAPLLAILEQGPPRSPLAAKQQASMVKGLLDAVKDEVTKQVTAAEKASGAELDKAVIDARVTARVKATTKEVLVSIQRWYRDLFLASLDVPEKQFAHPEHAERIKQLASGVTYTKALARLRKIEDAAQRMEYNPNAQALLESGLG